MQIVWRETQRIIIFFNTKHKSYLDANATAISSRCAVGYTHRLWATQHIHNINISIVTTICSSIRIIPITISTTAFIIISGATAISVSSIK